MARSRKPRRGRRPLGPDKLKLLGVRVRPELKARIENRAAAEGRTASAWSAEQLERALDAADPDA